MLQSIPNW